MNFQNFFIFSTTFYGLPFSLFSDRDTEIIKIYIHIIPAFWKGLQWTNILLNLLNPILFVYFISHIKVQICSSFGHSFEIRQQWASAHCCLISSLFNFLPLTSPSQCFIFWYNVCCLLIISLYYCWLWTELNNNKLNLTFLTHFVTLFPSKDRHEKSVNKCK